MFSPLEFWGYAPLSEKLRLGSRNWSARDVYWKPSRRTAWTRNDPVIEFPGMTPVQTRLPVPSFGHLGINQWGYPINSSNNIWMVSWSIQKKGWIRGSLHVWKPSMARYLLPSSGFFGGQPWKGLGTAATHWAPNDSPGNPINEASPILPEMDSYKPYTSIF